MDLTLSQIIALFLPIPVGFRCFRRRLSTVFGDMWLVASTLLEGLIVKSVHNGGHIYLHFSFVGCLSQYRNDVGGSHPHFNIIRKCSWERRTDTFENQR